MRPASWIDFAAWCGEGQCWSTCLSLWFTCSSFKQFEFFPPVSGANETDKYAFSLLTGDFLSFLPLIKPINIFNEAYHHSLITIGITERDCFLKMEMCFLFPLTESNSFFYFLPLEANWDVLWQLGQLWKVCIASIPCYILFFATPHRITIFHFPFWEQDW